MLKSTSKPKSKSALATKTKSTKTSLTTTKRNFQRPKIRLVRRGQVTDRRPNLDKKGILNEIAETIFLGSPLSYVKPEHSLHDQFLRMRLQHWDQWRNDYNGQLGPEDKPLPEVAPYELDRDPRMWPPYEKYVKQSEAEKGPLIFYRKSHLRYDEPSFIHVVKVQDKVRKNGYGRTTVLTAWHTWRGVTHPFPKQVTSRRKPDWRRLDPALGFMTHEIWAQLQKGELKPYYLPRPNYLDKSLEPAFIESEKVRHDDLIESTRSKVV
jgi:hypothetical protein